MGSEQATSLRKRRSSRRFGAAHRLAAMEVKWERDRLVWISNKKIVELGTNPSDKMLHKTVLVRNTHSALTSWDREEAGKKSGSKQGVKDGKLKLWRPHCRRKRQQWKREVSINVTKLAKQFGTFKVKSINKETRCVWEVFAKEYRQE